MKKVIIAAGLVIVMFAPTVSIAHAITAEECSKLPPAHCFGLTGKQCQALRQQRAECAELTRQDELEKQWAREQQNPPSPLSTLAPVEERSHGNYRALATSGNGCGNFGVVAIDEIEKVAAAVAQDSNPTMAFHRQLQPRMDALQREYLKLYSPYDARDIFMPDMQKVDEKTFRTCLPNFSKLMENVIARRDAAEKKMAAAEAERQSPHGRVTEGYALFRIVRYCNEVRRGYLVQYVNDEELARATTAIHAIVSKAKTEEPGIDTDALWNKSLDLARNRPVGEQMCQVSLADLLRMSPASVYDNSKPQ